MNGAHLQSSRSMEQLGPRYDRKECEGNGIYGPGPPMISDLNACLPYRSSMPSTSATDIQLQFYSAVDWDDIRLMKHWNKRKKKYPREPILLKLEHVKNI